jgi:hypothetical protein
MEPRLTASDRGVDFRGPAPAPLTSRFVETFLKTIERE